MPIPKSVCVFFCRILHNWMRSLPCQRTVNELNLFYVLRLAFIACEFVNVNSKLTIYLLEKHFNIFKLCSKVIIIYVDSLDSRSGNDFEIQSDALGRDTVSSWAKSQHSKA